MEIKRAVAQTDTDTLKKMRCEPNCNAFFYEAQKRQFRSTRPEQTIVENCSRKNIGISVFFVILEFK